MFFLLYTRQKEFDKKTNLPKSNCDGSNSSTVIQDILFTIILRNNAELNYRALVVNDKI